MNQCILCGDYHKLEDFAKSPGFLIDQKLDGFFIDRDNNNNIKNLIFQFERAEFIISWDKEKDSFKFSVAPR